MAVRTICSTLLVLSIPAAAAAQTPARFPVAGDRIRVSDAIAHTRFAGTLTRVSGDTLFITPSDSGPAAITRVVVTPRYTLERSLGRHPQTLSGLGTGLLVGGVIGGLIGASADCGSGNYLCGSRAQNAAMMAVVVGVPSMLLGAIIGTFSQGDTWQPVTPARLGVGIAPAPSGGVRFGGSFSF